MGPSADYSSYAFTTPLLLLADAPKSSPSRSLASHVSLPQVLASLRVFTVGAQAACVSFDQPVSSMCWSSRLCVEAGSADARGLTHAPVFMHAFDMVCNSLLAGSVDIVTALLPQVHDVPGFLEARPSVQRLLESFLRCATDLCDVEYLQCCHTCRLYLPSAFKPIRRVPVQGRAATLLAACVHVPAS